MKVAELWAELSTRGNLRTELRDADTALDRIGQTVTDVEQGLRRVEVPTALRRDARQAEDAVGRIDTAATQARAGLRRVELPETLRRDARQAEDAVSDIGRRGGAEAAQGVRGIGNALRESMSEAAAGARDSGVEGGGTFVAGFGSRVSALGGKAGPIGMALLAIVGVGVIAGKQLADAVMEGFEQNAQRDFSQQKFGMSDAQMQQAGKAAGGAFGNAWGESVQGNIDAAGIGIQTGLIDPGATAEQMQPIIEKLTMTSDLMGTEIPETAKAAGQAVRTGLVKNGVEAMDLFVAAQQNGLNISDDLLETVNEYGTQWRKVGIDGPTALGLISQAMKGGARDSDVAADAIKEFSIRAADGSELTNGAFEKMGLNAADLGNMFAKGGPAATQALDQILDKLRDMPPSLQKNEVAAALFGTQWEDLGGAFDKLDVSKAASELGMIEGATDRAANGMNNAQNAIQAAKNQISMASDTMKQKLGEAFAPVAMDFSAWVVGHKEEITGFFIGVGDAAMSFLIGSAKVASGLLRIWADTGGNIVLIGAKIVEAFAGVTKGVGSILKHIPGMKEQGEALVTVADGVGVYAQKVSGAKDAAIAVADAIDNTVVPGLERGRDKFRDMGAEARQSAENAQFLTDTVHLMPDGKTITVSDNSPESRKRLEDLGYVTRTLPNGQVVVDAQTAAAQAKLNEITKPKSVQITAEIINANANSASNRAIMDAYYRSIGRPTGTPTARADGGEEPAPHDASYLAGQRRMLVAENETGGEWYIPKTASKRARSTAVLANAADSFGYGLIPRADGGDETGLPPVAGSLWRAVKAQFPGATLNSGLRSGDSGYHGIGQAIDVGGPMQQIADFMMGAYKSNLAQLIWNAGPVLYNVKKNQVGTGIATAEGAEARAIYGEGTMAGHADHVHLAAEQELPAAAAGSAGPDSRTPQQKVEDAIVAKGREMGISDKGIQIALTTSRTESGSRILANPSNPESMAIPHDGEGTDHDSVGPFQQRDSWGSTADRMDPSKSAELFYNALKATDYNSDALSIPLAAQGVQRSAFADGSNYAKYAGGAGAALAESNARLAANGGNGVFEGSDPTSAPAVAGTASSGVQNVFVTGGKLDGSSAQVDGRKPTARFGVALYSRGGTVTGAGIPRVEGFGSDTVPSLLTPEEEVTRAPMARKHRALLKAIDQDRVAQFAEGGTVGGFGGYTTEGARYKKGYNWYDLLSGGVGAGFAVASAFGDDGKFNGFDTGSTDVPGTGALIERLTEIAKKPTVVIEHAEFPNAKDPEDLVKKVTGINPSRNQTRLNL